MFCSSSNFQFSSFIIYYIIMDSCVPILIHELDPVTLTCLYASIIPDLSNGGSHFLLCPDHGNILLLSDAQNTLRLSFYFSCPNPGAISFLPGPLVLLVAAYVAGCGCSQACQVDKQEDMMCMRALAQSLRLYFI